MLIHQRECHSYYRDVHYCVIMPRPLPSYWLRRLSTRRKNEHVHFSSQSNRSRIEAESQSNRNCNSRFTMNWRFRTYGKQEDSAQTGLNINSKQLQAPDNLWQPAAMFCQKCRCNLSNVHQIRKMGSFYWIIIICVDYWTLGNTCQNPATLTS